MKEATKFWMVWSPQGNTPTYRHSSREGADREASRLSTKCPGQCFYVLKAQGGFVTIMVAPPEPEPIRMIEDPIPF